MALLPSAEPGGRAMRAADAMYSIIGGYATPLRDMAAVQIGLRYLAARRVGELNVAFRTTLDAFSYRLDAWFTARASRRLQQMRDRKPTGVYTGGFGWVENLKPDARPDSEGYMLAPSLGQAATAAILRSGFMANHEQGAFNIDLDSNRTRLALGVLQGLTRDQPLTALYGYRIERALRDALLGKLIWPLRLAFPYRPAGNGPDEEPKEAIGARDVVDAVALMAIPLVLGTGVDYSIFMQLALRRHNGDLHAAYLSVGRALLLCGGTAIAGFGSLAWSSNRRAFPDLFRYCRSVTPPAASSRADRQRPLVSRNEDASRIA
jgi:hypothetical protein